MHLGINGRRLVGTRTGVARYLLNLLGQWNHMESSFDRMRVYTHQPLGDDLFATSEKVQNEAFGSFMPALAWENLPMRARSRGDAVLFCPSCRIPIGYDGKVVACVWAPHSLVPLELLPWWTRFYNRLYDYSARHSDLVLTCSEASRQELTDFYRLPPEKVKSVYLAPAEIFRRLDDPDGVRRIKEKYFGEAAPFVLSVGTLSLHRNTPMLLQAFGRTKREAQLPHRLLVVGKNFGGFDLATMAEENVIADSFVYADFVSEEDLILLYNAADVFVHPTRYDPTSLPVLEAMATGTPVITTAVSGIDEIAAGAAVLVDAPPTVESLSSALYSVLTNENLRLELSRKGLERSKAYSWKTTAAETMAILETVAGV